MTQASAPGKAILFGEHAVVYDQPAIAVPLSDLRTTVIIRSIDAQPPSVHVVATDLDHSFWLHEMDDRDPLAYAIRLALQATMPELQESFEISVSSKIPIASGLGSGAAASVAIIRALSSFFKVDLSDASISALAYRVEKLHHGTPSGIDNSTIAFEQALYYKRNQDPQPFSLGRPLQLVLGHCGVDSQTGAVVAAVRDRWQASMEEYSAIFSQIGELVERGYDNLKAGDHKQVGILMNENHALLQRIGVSNQALDQLVARASTSGAYGAKLSGAGAGGFMIALVGTETRESVARALQDAGARHILVVQVSG